MTSGGVRALIRRGQIGAIPMGGERTVRNKIYSGPVPCFYVIEDYELERYIAEGPQRAIKARQARRHGQRLMKLAGRKPGPKPKPERSQFKPTLRPQPSMIGNTNAARA